MDSNKVEAFFLEALEYIDLEQREEYLRSQCQSEALLDEVKLMLTDLEKSNELFECEANSNNSFVSDVGADNELCLGNQINGFTLLDKLGEGSCGIVYEASQEKPFQRKVAFKVLRNDLNSKSILRRFKVEFHILAQMNSPHIASIYDAGITDCGRPYFVMELVHGATLIEYSRSNDLTLEDRLELVCQLCTALQHAHEKGIIHRDLKPSNVLVTYVDEKPLLKVIDFGIAKITASPESFSSDNTSYGEVIGTPAYMSPEQICCDASKISVRTDVYGIGALLYELVTSKPPFDNQELINSGLDVMRSKISEGIVPLPSSSLKRVKRTGKNTLRELDFIVLKAMSKDPENRYRSAQDLGDDIKNYLNGFSVNAYPISRSYVFKKWFIRNRLIAISLLSILVTLFTGFTVSTMLYIRAKNAEHVQSTLRAKAEERAHVAYAAILLDKKNYFEANEEINKMSTPLSEPSLEATKVFEALIWWNGLKADWKTAAARLMDLYRVYQFDTTNTDNLTRNLKPVTAVMIKGGHLNDYYSFCDLLLDHFEGNENPITCQHLLKICSFLPLNSERQSKLQAFADIAEHSLRNLMPKPFTDIQTWRCLNLAFWNYRISDYEKAGYWLEKSNNSEGFSKSGIAYSKCIDSMILMKQGNYSLSEKKFEEVMKMVKTHTKIPLTYHNEGVWYDWLNAELLLDQAIKLKAELE